MGLLESGRLQYRLHKDINRQCYCKFSVALLHGALGWPAVCDCGISYSLTFLLKHISAFQKSMDSNTNVYLNHRQAHVTMRKRHKNTGQDRPI